MGVTETFVLGVNMLAASSGVEQCAWENGSWRFGGGCECERRAGEVYVVSSVFARLSGVCGKMVLTGVLGAAFTGTMTGLAAGMAKDMVMAPAAR